MMAKMRGFVSRLNNQGFMPRNTLSSAKRPPEPNESPPRDSPPLPEPSPAKRQKTDEMGHFSESRLMPLDEPWERSPESVARSEPRSQSTASVYEDALGSKGELREFRSVNDMVSGHYHGRRHRRKRDRSSGDKPLLPGSFLDVNERDPINNSSDESSPEKKHARRRYFTGGPRLVAPSRPERPPLKEPDPADEEIARSRPRHQPSPTRGAKRRSRDESDEPDELSGDVTHTHLITRNNKKISLGRPAGQASQSASLSRRGDIKPSLPRSPNDLGNLSLKGAVRLPNHVYSSAKDAPSCRVYDESCFLKVLYPPDRGLAPFHVDGTPFTEYGWLQVDLTKLRVAQYSRDSGILKVLQSASSEGGALMFLEFFDANVVPMLAQWLDTNGADVQSVDKDLLQRSYHKAIDDVKSHLDLKSRQVPTQTLDHSQQPWATKKAEQQPKTPLGRPFGSGCSGGGDGGGADRREAVEKRRMAATDAVARPEPSDPPSEDGPLRSQRAPPERRSRRLRGSPSKISSDSPEPPRWTELHPDWDETWQMPLVYRRTTIEKGDIRRLDEGECLNDNIIDFYLRHLLSQLEASRPEVAKRLYFHNSFFYDKLKPSKGRDINYDGVKTWTAKVDIFSYDYVIVPVNEHFHWWVAIICNPGKMDPESTSNDTDGSHQDEADHSSAAAADQREDADVKRDVPGAKEETPIDVDASKTTEDMDAVQLVQMGRVSMEEGSAEPENKARPEGAGRDGENSTVDLDGEDNSQQSSKPAGAAARKAGKHGKKPSGPGPRKYDPRDPRIITLDSLGNSHSPACSYLKQYLIAEFRDKKNKTVDYAQPIGMKATNIPEQNNFCDCGIYLLGYIQEFLKDPDGLVQSILQREQKKWDFVASDTRNSLRDLIFDLHAKYQDEQERLRLQKAKGKRSKPPSSPLARPADDDSVSKQPRPAMEGGGQQGTPSRQSSVAHPRPGSAAASPNPKPGSREVTAPPTTPREPKRDSHREPPSPGRLERTVRESSGKSSGNEGRGEAAPHKSPAPRSAAAAFVHAGPSNLFQSIEVPDDTEMAGQESRPTGSNAESKAGPNAESRAESKTGSRPRSDLKLRRPTTSPDKGDIQFLNPIPPSPSAGRGGRHMPHETSPASFYNRPQSRHSAAESRPKPARNDPYVVPNSPPSMTTRKRFLDSGTGRSPYFSTAGTSGGRSRPLSHRGAVALDKDHPIDLTDD